MRAMHWFNPRFQRQAAAVILAGSMMLLAGCQKDVVHQRSISELTQKAQAMMQAGDYNGAVARLEAAYDLQPNEVKTKYNLAVAYQMQGNYDKALSLFTELQNDPGMNKGEIQKAMGISYEAKADLLEQQAGELESDPKADKAQLQEKQQAAAENYQLAMQSYQQALATGVKNTDEVQKQIDALNAKLNPDTAQTEQEPQ